MKLRPPCRTVLARLFRHFYFLLAFPLFALAATDSKTRFDIPAGAASVAFKVLVEQSGTEIFFASDVVKGVQTNAVAGEFTAREAVTRMLAGTGLVAVERNGAIVVNREKDPNAAGVVSKESRSHPVSQEPGTVEGRVFNRSSGSFLHNARVSVPGTTLETSTDAGGYYRLSRVPSGDVELRVKFVGLTAEPTVIHLPSGGTVVRDVAMQLSGEDRDVTTLDAIEVTDRQMSGRASALHEMRNAPNVKNVVSFDEFGEMGEGNFAEYLKFVPGFDTTYNPANPANISLRGMPSSGTLITMDGITVASTNAGVSRTHDVSMSGTSLIDRVEVSKTPTPDMPANAVGGSINIITKSGFSQARATLKYNVFFTDESLEGIEDYEFSLKKVAGPDKYTTGRKPQPSFNLFYAGPLNDKVAITAGVSYFARLSQYNLVSPTWDRVALVQTANNWNLVTTLSDNVTYSGSVDWRLSPNDLVTFTAQRNSLNSQTHGTSFRATLGAGAVGNSTYSQGAATGVGQLSRGYTNNYQEKDADIFTLRYKHNGPVWKYDAHVSYSEGEFNSGNKDHMFSTVTTTNSLNGNLILRMDNLTSIGDFRNPVYSATNRAGQPVDIFRADVLSITDGAINTNRRQHEVGTAAMNLERKFDLRLPVTIKVGAQADRHRRVMSNDAQSLSFNPPTGAAGRLVSNYDIVSRDFANREMVIDANGNAQKVMHLDLQKTYDLYLQNPSWWTLNEVTRHTTWVNNRRNFEEMIGAGYIRGDVRALDNRLWLVGGVRYEKTTDKGAGPRDDISATYVKNPDGTPARTSTGALIPITTNALELAKLRYRALGAVSKKSYDGFYPSLNSSFEITRDLIMRAAYARTIGRPELTEIIPGATVADPGAAEANRTITVNNPGLNPWTADNFDLTLEAYSIKDVSASVSLFQKDVKNFFATTHTPASQAYLESLGVVWEETYTSYDVVSKRNAGSATLRGIELSYRHTLSFLPRIGKRMQVYANYTSMEVSGPDAANFAFAPQRINWGIGYYGRKFSANLNAALGKPLRQAAVASNATTPANSFNYITEYPRHDLSVEYNFSRRFGVYFSVRNLNGTPQRQYTYNGNTPDYARPRQYQFAAARLSLGVKGEW